MKPIIRKLLLSIVSLNLAAQSELELEWLLPSGKSTFAYTLGPEEGAAYLIHYASYTISGGIHVKVLGNKA